MFPPHSQALTWLCCVNHKRGKRGLVFHTIRGREKRDIKREDMTQAPGHVKFYDSRGSASPNCSLLLFVFPFSSSASQRGQLVRLHRGRRGLLRPLGPRSLLRRRPLLLLFSRRRRGGRHRRPLLPASPPATVLLLPRLPRRLPGKGEEKKVTQKGMLPNYSTRYRRGELSFFRRKKLRCCLRPLLVEECNCSPLTYLRFRKR